MKRTEFIKIMKFLSMVMKCPACQAEYETKQLKLIENNGSLETGEQHLTLHASCTQCSTTILFTVDVAGNDVIAIASVTDLTPRDIIKFQKLESLQIDDCITIHRALQSFKGDFVKAFAVKPASENKVA